MDQRIATAQRRKTLLERRKRFDRQVEHLTHQLHRDDVAHQRQSTARSGADTAAEQYEKYFTASGPGAAWRAREHVTLRHSPRNLRRGVYLDDADDPRLQPKKQQKQISEELYARLSFQSTKKSTAEVDELFY